jgi:hypothetical protein
MHEGCIATLLHQYPHLQVYYMGNSGKYAVETTNLPTCVQKLLYQLCTGNRIRLSSLT